MADFIISSALAELPKISLPPDHSISTFHNLCIWDVTIR